MRRLHHRLLCYALDTEHVIIPSRVVVDEGADTFPGTLRCREREEAPCAPSGTQAGHLRIRASTGVTQRLPLTSGAPARWSLSSSVPRGYVAPVALPGPGTRRLPRRPALAVRPRGCPALVGRPLFRPGVLTWPATSRSDPTGSGVLGTGTPPGGSAPSTSRANATQSVSRALARRCVHIRGTR